MEPISMYFGAIVVIIDILFISGSLSLRVLTAISIISIFWSIFRYVFSSHYCEIGDNYYYDSRDFTHVLISIAIISTGILLYESLDVGIIVLVITVPIMLFLFLLYVEIEITICLVIGISILHFFGVPTKILLVITIFSVGLYEFLASRGLKIFCDTHNELVNSYNLVIKDRDNTVRERDEAIEERDELKKKFKHLDYSDDYF
ncbi:MULTISPECIES: hypothetical protein [Bartonella]|uniref:hypothetical protein n=1 Tax=Bartonella TaxID=773 RepID=UPI002362FCB2|nr:MULTISPECIES: hypothetical protein [Bartonella]